MNPIFQNIAIAAIGIIAIAYLVRKYFWSPKKKSSNSCGNDSCGC